MPSTSKKRELALDDLVIGASHVFQNAADLFQEASVLHAGGSLSRAFFLHQISLEECAKVEMLGASAASILMGMEVDKRKLIVAFANHKAKNYTNAYFLPAKEAESEARCDGRWHDANEVFKQHQAEFHHESNAAKNASLYVDIGNGVFATPKERITETMATEIERTNAEFLSGAELKVEMMRRWQSEPDRAQNMMKWFKSRMEEMRSRSPNNPEGALSVIMDEMLARAKKSDHTDND